jgi:hypothetical protein
MLTLCSSDIQVKLNYSRNPFASLKTNTSRPVALPPLSLSLSLPNVKVLFSVCFTASSNLFHQDFGCCGRPKRRSPTASTFSLILSHSLSLSLSLYLIPLSLALVILEHTLESTILISTSQSILPPHLTLVHSFSPSLFILHCQLTATLSLVHTDILVGIPLSR